MSLRAHSQVRSFFIILLRTFRQTTMHSTGVRLRLGLALLIFNFPFGYGCLFLGSALAAIFKQHQWLLIGGAGYIISWLMLATGTVLVGKEMKNKFLKTWQRKKKAWKILQQKKFP